MKGTFGETDEEEGLPDQVRLNPLYISKRRDSSRRQPITRDLRERVTLASIVTLLRSDDFGKATQSSDCANHVSSQTTTRLATSGATAVQAGTTFRHLLPQARSGLYIYSHSELANKSTVVQILLCRDTMM